jgi:hypothetical protein
MKKTEVNNTPYYETQLKIADSGWSRCQSTVNAGVFSDYWKFLLGILANQMVSVRIYSKTNLCGQTSEKQLRECAEIFRDKMDPVYTKNLDNILALLIEKFGDGTLSFNLSNHDVVLLPNELQALIDDYEENEVYKQTTYVHIMAWKTESDYDAFSEDNSIQPYHVDSMSKEDWKVLGKTPDAFAKSYTGKTFYDVFIERD